MECRPTFQQMLKLAYSENQQFVINLNFDGFLNEHKSILSGKREKFTNLLITFRTALQFMRFRGNFVSLATKYKNIKLKEVCWEQMKTFLTSDNTIVNLGFISDQAVSIS